jgi:hypothetical protein
MITLCGDLLGKPVLYVDKVARFYGTSSIFRWQIQVLSGLLCMSADPRDVGGSFVLAHYQVKWGLVVVWQGGFSRDGYVAVCPPDRKNHPVLEGRKLRVLLLALHRKSARTT